MATTTIYGGSVFTVATPIYAGGYQLGGPNGLQINIQRKPSSWHRFWMRVCLGWVWVDTP